MRKRFVALREDLPADDWLARFVAGRAEAEAWYLGGRAPAPPAAKCEIRIKRHMPELLGLYRSACELVGDDDLAARIISQYRPPPMLHGCTQAVCLGALMVPRWFGTTTFHWRSFPITFSRRAGSAAK